MKEWASSIKRDVIVLYYVLNDKRISFFVRFIAFLVFAYALSPIDLIPDFIPVLGYIDDIIILPLGIYVLFRLIPENILTELREKSSKQLENKKIFAVYGTIIVLFIWLLIILLLIRQFYF